ncbi:hypothetical protein D3C84_799750 [compost metagenome]
MLAKLLNSQERSRPNNGSNSANASRAMPNTCRLDIPRLTSTRSMMFSNSSGVTRATNCSISETSNTLRNCRTCLRIDGQNQATPKAGGFKPVCCSASNNTSPCHSSARSSRGRV